MWIGSGWWRLFFSEGALETSSDHQSGGVSLCGRANQDHRGQAIQKSAERDGGHLEDLNDRRETFPETRCTGASGRSGRRGRLCRWSQSEEGRKPDRRLISFTHLLTESRKSR